MMERLRGGRREPPRARRPGAGARGASPAPREADRMGDGAAPRFAPGDRVRVRRMRPAGHTRCPRYARGVAGGVIEASAAPTACPTAPSTARRPSPSPSTRSLPRRTCSGAPAASRRSRWCSTSGRATWSRHEQGHGHDHGAAPASGRRRISRCARGRSRRCWSRRGLISTDAIDAIIELLRARRRPPERRARGRARLGRPRLPRAPAGRRHERRSRELGYRRAPRATTWSSSRTRPASTTWSSARSAPATRGRVLGLPPDLVQEQRLPRPRGGRAARGAARVRRRARPTTSRCASRTRAPRCATSCCRCAPRAPRAWSEDELARAGQPRRMIGTDVPQVPTPRCERAPTPLAAVGRGAGRPAPLPRDRTASSSSRSPGRAARSAWRGRAGAHRRLAGRSSASTWWRPSRRAARGRRDGRATPTTAPGSRPSTSRRRQRLAQRSYAGRMPQMRLKPSRSSVRASPETGT